MSDSQRTQVGPCPSKLWISITNFPIKHIFSTFLCFIFLSVYSFDMKNIKKKLSKFKNCGVLDQNVIKLDLKKPNKSALG